jgi:hypothetical protein
MQVLMAATTFGRLVVVIMTIAMARAIHLMAFAAPFVATE